ncbi:MAG: hemerythrin family protein [Rhodospirillaceae bacterium]|nr:hemerythrin family protein [Rhodospirillales bacterium]
MSIIMWTSELSVGVERLDEHHRRLIDLVNQLGTAVASHDAQQVTGLVLGELTRYVFYHFGEEERLMELAGYEDLTAHRQSHRIMAEHVRTLERNYDADASKVVAAELYAFLADWLVHHIRSEDLRYKPALAAPQPIA